MIITLKYCVNYPTQVKVWHDKAWGVIFGARPTRNERFWWSAKKNSFKIRDLRWPAFENFKVLMFRGEFFRILVGNQHLLSPTTTIHDPFPELVWKFRACWFQLATLKLDRFNFDVRLSWDVDRLSKSFVEIFWENVCIREVGRWNPCFSVDKLALDGQIFSWGVLSQDIFWIKQFHHNKQVGS